MTGAMFTQKNRRRAQSLAKDGTFSLAIHSVSLFLSPHSHIPSKIGMRDLPRCVRLYSTLGGIGVRGFPLRAAQMYICAMLAPSPPRR